MAVMPSIAYSTDTSNMNPVTPHYSSKFMDTSPSGLDPNASVYQPLKKWMPSPAHRTIHPSLPPSLSLLISQPLSFSFSFTGLDLTTPPPPFRMLGDIFCCGFFFKFSISRLVRRMSYCVTVFVVVKKKKDKKTFKGHRRPPSRNLLLLEFFFSCKCLETSQTLACVFFVLLFFFPSLAQKIGSLYFSCTLLLALSFLFNCFLLEGGDKVSDLQLSLFIRMLYSPGQKPPNFSPRLNHCPFITVKSVRVVFRPCGRCGLTF